MCCGRRTTCEDLNGMVMPESDTLKKKVKGVDKENQVNLPNTNARVLELAANLLHYEMERLGGEIRGRNAP